MPRATMRQFTVSSMATTEGSPSGVRTAVVCCRPRQPMIRSVKYFGCNEVRSTASTAEAISGDTCTLAEVGSPLTLITLSPLFSSVSHGEAGLAATVRLMSLSIMVLPPQAESIIAAVATTAYFVTANFITCSNPCIPPRQPSQFSGCAPPRQSLTNVKTHVGGTKAAFRDADNLFDPTARAVMMPN